MIDPVDNLKAAIGSRIKEARAALEMTQKELCETIGMPLPSLRDYELCKRIPGGEAIAMFCCAGINANWLLLGEGPMLITDQQAMAPGDGVPADAPGAPHEMIYSRSTVSQPLVAHDAAVAAPAFNLDAFQAILIGILEAGAPPKKAVGAAFEFYEMSIKRGLITVDGSVPQGKTAA